MKTTLGDNSPLYSDTLPSGKHWSLRMRKGIRLRLTDLEGGANVGMLFYNPENLLERYNAPDTLKCQHTFKLTETHCLYSDMGRIFCSIIEDTAGWHDTVCGNSTQEIVEERWGKKEYQEHHNDCYRNGYNSFLVELAKYGLNERDMASNLNLFSKVSVDETGQLIYHNTNSAGTFIDLRFEMDTLVILHTCPHPLNTAENYPIKPVKFEILQASPVVKNDACKNSCPENQRGFQNNALYHIGRGE